MRHSMIHEYERQVAAAFHINHKADPIAHAALGITGEAGEVADLVKKSQYSTPRPIDRDTMVEELGDVLWYVAAMAMLHGSSIEEIARRNIEKLAVRHPAEPYSVRALVEAMA